MKSLTATLEAAQIKNSTAPYVSAVLADYHGRGERFRFTRVYTGSEAAGYAAVVVAGDGSLIRARIDSGTLYTSRITSPGSGSTFSSWTSHGSVSASGAVALAVSGSSVYLFFVHADTVQVRVQISADNGASYGAAATLATAGAAVTYLAAAANVGGNVVCFWTVGADVWSNRYASSSWGTPAAWGLTVDSITGLAAHWVADFQVVITGLEDTTQDGKLWTILFGDGWDLSADTWGSLLAVESAAADTLVTFHSPAVDLAGTQLRMFYGEKTTHDVASRKVQQSWMDNGYTFTDDLWREPWPISYVPTDDLGVAMAYASSKLWLVTSKGVWLGEQLASVDVSADVVACRVELEEHNGRVELELRNEDGRYTGHASVSRGMRLALAPGYVTAAGAEAVTAAWYWVETVELLTGARPRVVLHCRDAWWLVERWHARRTYAWAAGATGVYNVIAYVLARAGLVAGAGDASTTAQTWEPALVLHPGESGKAAVLRMLGSVPDVIRWSQYQGNFIEPEAGDTVDYEYGLDHAIVSGRYVDSTPGRNRARAVGAGAVLDEAYDYADIEAVGERSHQVIDLNLDSGSRVTNRAGFELDEAQIRARRDEVRVFGVNCGQELFDVVELTDAQAGLDGDARRVVGVSWRFETRPSSASGGTDYTMTLTLGEV